MSSASRQVAVDLPPNPAGELVLLDSAASPAVARPTETMPGILSAGSLPHRLLKDRETLLHWVQWLGCIGLAVGLLHLLATRFAGEQALLYNFLAVTTALSILVVYRATGVFRCYRSRLACVLRLSQSWILVLALLFGVVTLTQTFGEYSLLLLSTWAALALVGQISFWLVTEAIGGVWQRRLQASMPALVVGTGRTARHLAESINRNPFLPDFVSGVVLHPGSSDDWDNAEIPVLGDVDDLMSIIDERDVDRVYIALPVDRSADVTRLQRSLIDKHVDVIWAPDIFSLQILNPGVSEIAGVPLISLSESPIGSGGRAFLKSLMDVCIASLVLVLTAPLMLAVAAIIKATSKGPVFFRQERHGWDGSVFEVWKFRSMYLHDDSEVGVKQATRDDPRITPIGRFIRRTSIDELPQLFNVLNGTMSLVGPRPHAVSHNLHYGSQIQAYMARHRVKPGITGWAQINGFRGETDTVEKMQQRVRLDLEYINRWSLWRDLWILLVTPFALLSDAAY